MTENEIELYKQQLRYIRAAYELAMTGLERIAENDDIGEPDKYAKIVIEIAEKWRNKSVSP